MIHCQTMSYQQLKKPLDYYRKTSEKIPPAAMFIHKKKKIDSFPFPKYRGCIIWSISEGKFLSLRKKFLRCEVNEQVDKRCDVFMLFGQCNRYVCHRLDKENFAFLLTWKVLRCFPLETD